MPVLQDVLDFTSGGGKDKDKKSGSKGLLAKGIGAAMAPFAGKIPGFKKGGKVHKTGIYKLHKGETVIPTGKNGCQCHKDSSASMTE